MFTVLQKVVGYLWYGDEHDELPHPEDDAMPTETALTHPKWKTVTGKVSHIYSGHGLVDGEIYFSFANVLGGVRPTVGDVVNVVSKQENKGGGWKGVQVTVLSEVWDAELSPSAWDGSSVDAAVAAEEEVPEKKDDIIGKVTSYADGEGLVNDNIAFSGEVCMEGYVAFAGDWVKIQAVVADDDLPCAVSISPLRTLQFEGEITAIRDDHGYVETKDGRSIFYHVGVIEPGYFPRRRDIVRGKALESSQGQCVWRATSLTPAVSSVVSQRPMNAGTQAPISKEDLQHLRKNKHGIYVSGDTDFGTLSSGEMRLREVWVENNGIQVQTLLGCHIHGQSKMFSVKGIRFMFEHAHLSASGKKRNPDVSANERAVLYPAMGLYVAVVCEASYIGCEEQLLVLQFDGFCIGQQLSVSVTDPHQLYIEPVPSNSYQGNRSQVFQRARSGKNGGWVVPGQRPINRFRGRFQLPQRLPQFPVPDELRDCVFDQGELTEVRPQLQQELSMNCYAGKFHTLLHLEEIQMDIDIRQFDLEQVCLRPVGEFLCLGVPDLAEGRPSLLIGDKVILSEPGSVEGVCYEGYIHEVLSEEVLLKFHNSFHQNFKGESYDVVFTFNRSTMRRCHQAVDMALQLSEQVLFPEDVVPKLPQWTPLYREPEMVTPVNNTPVTRPHGLKGKSRPLELFNPSLNQRQQEAVIRIALGQGRPTPYILFGPPGTGKTVTVVESILQIFMKVPHSRIIACTPSNSAADLLTERLQQSEQLTTADMVRINALQRTEESIPDIIRPYCYDDTNLQLVSHYRIIVCTCASAGMLLSLGIKVGHFTHVFVDEAGQATEPECLIPLSLIGQSDGQIVLAGDPHQLGPVLASKFAKSYGLELSLLERLTLLPVYQRDTAKYEHGYNPLLVTKLVDNYRSHECLLRLPSRLFYHDELCVRANPQLTHSFSDWLNLPTNGFPLIFHGVRGEDMREGNSPSWFNPAETVQVVQYVQMLLHEEPHRIASEEIGIITAYRKQVEKIRLLMEKLGIPKIKVGSVEEFQGQERKAVIISTVRSTENLLHFDVRHNLGFLSNPKRFNVSITRAQAILIVVGNPFVLSQDPYWRALIDYSVDSGAYTGCDLPDDYSNNNS